MSTVLLVGEDELLLQTRAAVLRTTGAETLCCRPDSALTAQQDRECEVVILCHSLAEDISSALAESFHVRWPKTRILLMTATRMWEQADSDAAVDAISSADPERLIQRTAELLARHRPRPEDPRIAAMNR